MLWSERQIIPTVYIFFYKKCLSKETVSRQFSSHTQETVTVQAKAAALQSANEP